MNVAKILTSATLAMTLAACTAPNQTGTNTGGKTSTEVKKTITGTITKKSASNAKVALLTADGDNDTEAGMELANKLFSSSETENMVGATIVTPNADGTYSFDVKLGAKAQTVAYVQVWNDLNNDNKMQTSETFYASNAENQLNTQFRLTKDSFKQVKTAEAIEPAAKYDWVFPDVTQTVTLHVTKNSATTPKFALVTADGNNDVELAAALRAALTVRDADILPGATVVLPSEETNSYSLEIKLGSKPYRAVLIMGWDDLNGDGKVDATEIGLANVPGTQPAKVAVGAYNEENNVALRVSNVSIADQNVKVLKQGENNSPTPTISEGATEYTWVFPAID